LEMHKEQFTPANTVLIEKDGSDIGWISRFHYDDKIKVDEMYIIPEYQRKGIGSSLLGDTILEAKSADLPIRLRVFKINPAVRLYQRHGFQIYDEDGPFYFMERKKDER
jgi:GNAT superfamily N-acetyltransferase